MSDLYLVINSSPIKALKLLRNLVSVSYFSPFKVLSISNNSLGNPSSFSNFRDFGCSEYDSNCLILPDSEENEYVLKT